MVPEIREKIPEMDWRAMCGMRDVLIHGYVGVDLNEVWNMAVNYLPQLSQALQKFLLATPQ